MYERKLLEEHQFIQIIGPIQSFIDFNTRLLKKEKDTVDVCKIMSPKQIIFEGRSVPDSVKRKSNVQMLTRNELNREVGVLRFSPYGTNTKVSGGSHGNLQLVPPSEILTRGGITDPAKLFTANTMRVFQKVGGCSETPNPKVYFDHPTDPNRDASCCSQTEREKKGQPHIKSAKIACPRNKPINMLTSVKNLAARDYKGQPHIFHCTIRILNSTSTNLSSGTHNHLINKTADLIKGNEDNPDVTRESIQSTPIDTLEFGVYTPTGTDELSLHKCYSAYTLGKAYQPTSATILEITDQFEKTKNEPQPLCLATNFSQKMAIGRFLMQRIKLGEWDLAHILSDKKGDPLHKFFFMKNSTKKRSGINEVYSPNFKDEG